MKSVDLAFESYGNHGTCPIIILHGFLASSRNWRTVARRLAEKHHVLVLDMRNHGQSPHDERMDYPAMAYDVIEFMNKMGLATAHLLGHSMGGKVAMHLALTYPERVQSLMVADIAPVNYKPDGNSHNFSPMIRALRQLPLDTLKTRKEAEQSLAESIPDISFRQFLLQNLLLKDERYYWRINLDIIQNTAHHIAGFPEIPRRTFSNKALFIAGQISDYVRPEAVLKFFPDAEIVEIPDTGHWLYVQAPEEFCRIVDGWVSEV